jgi:hypothetical protein
MSEQSCSSLAERLADVTAIEAAFRRSVREAVLTHARAGRPVATWRDGKVVWLQPDEVFALIANETQSKYPT